MGERRKSSWVGRSPCRSGLAGGSLPCSCGPAALQTPASLLSCFPHGTWWLENSLAGLKTRPGPGLVVVAKSLHGRDLLISGGGFFCFLVALARFVQAVGFLPTACEKTLGRDRRGSSSLMHIG